MKMKEEDISGMVLSKGIDFRELMASGTEFQIDADFKGEKDKSDPLLLDEEEVLKEDLFNILCDDDSDSDDPFREIDEKAAKHFLSSPDYISFTQLASQMTDCLPSGEVKMLIIEEGDGPLVPYDAQISMHYAGYWEKESVPFDSSLMVNDGAPVTYRLGLNQLLPGLEIGLTSIHGPKARVHLLIRDNAAWGSRGALPRIRPDPALFIVSLLSVCDVSAAERFNELPQEEQKKYATTVKAVTASNGHAKTLFQKGRYLKAVKHYHKSLTVLQTCCPETDEENEKRKEMLVNLYMNLAVTYYKLNVPYKIILMCDDLARITNVDKHCKALFYYGRAFQMQGEYEDAVKFYKKALKLEPKNSEIGHAMAKLDAIIKKSAKDEKKMWQNAFKDDKSVKSEVLDSDFNIDDEFKNNLKATCEDLALRSEYVKFDLPAGLTRDETEYIKVLVTQFDKLSVVENGEGSKKKISIVKKNY